MGAGAAGGALGLGSVTAGFTGHSGGRSLVGSGRHLSFGSPEGGLFVAPDGLVGVSEGLVRCPDS
jgi:hypothetical protein